MMRPRRDPHVGGSSMGRRAAALAVLASLAPHAEDRVAPQLLPAPAGIAVRKLSAQSTSMLGKF